MHLLDSNILIYSSKDEYRFLRKYITPASGISAVSIATVIEVLGYHQLAPQDQAYFESCFALLHQFEVDHAVSNKAIQLRQLRKRSLGDSIIAATALIHNCELVTRNISDFQDIPNLKLHNPFL